MNQDPKDGDNVNRAAEADVPVTVKAPSKRHCLLVGGVLLLLVVGVAIGLAIGLARDNDDSSYEAPTPSPLVPTPAPPAPTPAPPAPTPEPPIPVTPDDITLVPPDRGGGPIIAAITAYNWRDDQTWPDDQFELPIYRTQDLDQAKPEFWNYLLDELLFSRLDLILLHGRGCHDLDDPTNFRGTGNMCPRWLANFVAAVERAGVQDVVRVGMWDDTAMYRTARNVVLGTNDEKFDVSDENNWTFFWDYNIKIWFDTIPSYMWFRIDGKPVIASYNLRNDRFENQEGNASLLLDWLSQQFSARYRVEPYFIQEETWFTLDSTVGLDQADGQHEWFTPPMESFTTVQYNGQDWSMIIPGFRNPRTTPGCGDTCREVLRNNGATLENAFSSVSSSDFIMLEGWTNMIESNGVYRSDDWSYPNQYIGIVRRQSDPEPNTLLFQAEAADEFFDTTPQNIGGEFSDRALDVGLLGNDLGWYVGWTEAGEWIEFRDIFLGCGTYRVSARVATASPTGVVTIRLQALGSLVSVTVPNTSSGTDFQLLHLAELQLDSPGLNTIRIEFETGGVNLDWFFFKRDPSACADTDTGILGWIQGLGWWRSDGS